MQVQFLSLLSGGAVRFETAPHARIYGAEFDALWQVARETLPGLVVTANGAWLHAKYTDYPDASGFTDIGIPFGGGRSEEHTSELQSLMRISYSVLCLKKKQTHNHKTTYT